MGIYQNWSWPHRAHVSSSQPDSPAAQSIDGSTGDLWPTWIGLRNTKKSQKHLRRSHRQTLETISSTLRDQASTPLRSETLIPIPRFSDGQLSRRFSADCWSQHTDATQDLRKTYRKSSDSQLDRSIKLLIIKSIKVGAWHSIKWHYKNSLVFYLGGLTLLIISISTHYGKYFLHSP